MFTYRFGQTNFFKSLNYENTQIFLSAHVPMSDKKYKKKNTLKSIKTQSPLKKNTHDYFKQNQKKAFYTLHSNILLELLTLKAW